MNQRTPTRRDFIRTAGVAVAGATLPSNTSAEDLDAKPPPEEGDRLLTIGLIQMRCGGDPSASVAKAVKLIKEARGKGADVVVLPELFATRYFCQEDSPEAIATAKREYAVRIPGPTTEALAASAKDNRVVLIGGSVFERAEDKYFNTSVVFGPDGSQLGYYRKTHIPHDPGFWEQHYFTRGDTGVRVFETPFGKIAVQICYDQWFPELARVAVLKGAEVLVYPTALGDVDSLKDVDEGNWQQMWTAAQVGHAACSNIYVAAVNRVGHEGKVTFFGGSFVADPMGRVVQQGGVAEEIIVARCNLSFAASTRKGWRFFEERRPSQYADLVK